MMLTRTIHKYGADKCIVQSTQSCPTWNGEPEATAGKPQVAADVEFYLDIDESSGVEMVHVADPKPQRRQPEFLVRDIARQAPRRTSFKATFANMIEHPDEGS